jgi:hypothetical protein
MACHRTPVSNDMGSEEQSEIEDWSRDKQKFAVLSWISFLFAAAFTMLFFAFIDPLVIVDSINVSFIESRNAGYAIGFVFLWAHGWIGGWYILRLCRRKRTKPHPIRR